MPAPERHDDTRVVETSGTPWLYLTAGAVAYAVFPRRCYRATRKNKIVGDRGETNNPADFYWLKRSLTGTSESS
jgi:hypothetical protein